MQVINEPLGGNFLFDQKKETIAAQHHALQDVQGHLLNRSIEGGGVDEAGDLRADNEGGKMHKTITELCFQKHVMTAGKKPF